MEDSTYNEINSQIEISTLAMISLNAEHGEFAEIHVGHLEKYNNFSISTVVGSIAWKSKGHELLIYVMLSFGVCVYIYIHI